MLEKLKKEVLEGNEIIKFLSDFDLYGSYDELLDQVMDVSVMVLDLFDYDHRDLNKRFVDVSVEAGVKKVYYLQKYSSERLVGEEQAKLEKYIKDYPGLDASFIELPMTMEKLYSSISNHEDLPNKNFTVMSEADISKALKKILLLQENDKLTYSLKGLAYDDLHDYYQVFESKENLPMKQFKQDFMDFELTSWSEFVQTK